MSGVIALFVLGGPMFSFLYGDDYRGASQIAWSWLWLTLRSRSRTSSSTFVSPQHKSFPLVPAVAVILEPLLLLLMHGSANTFAVIIGVVGVVLLFALIPATAWERALQILLRRQPVDTVVG